MLKAAKISLPKMASNIVLFAGINFVVYVALFLSLKYMNVLNLSGFLMLNYVTLAFVSLYQIHALIKKNQAYIPFLESFVLIFLTGTLSFMFFSIYIFIYSWLDPLLYELFIMDSGDQNKLIAAMLIFFEGSGASIVIGLIAMFYSGRYQDDEASI